MLRLQIRFRLWFHSPSLGTLSDSAGEILDLMIVEGGHLSIISGDSHFVIGPLAASLPMFQSSHDGVGFAVV